MNTEQANYKPKRIALLGSSSLHIFWSDGLEQRISSSTLRKHCPSAITRAQAGDESHDKPLTAKKSLLRIIEHSREEELALEEVWQVGNYALGMRFRDGLDSGIYTFELLRSLGSEEDLLL